MSLNLTLGLAAAIIWFGAFFWYFRGGDRIKSDVAGFLARLGLRRKASPDDEATRQ